MLPLKRSLNPSDIDDDENTRYKSDPTSRWASYGDIALSDEPVLTNPSWSEVWTELLGSNENHGNFSSDPQHAEPSLNAFNDAEYCIESWVGQNVPSSKASAIPTEYDTAAGAIPQDPSVLVADQLCYGMVHRVPVKLLGDMSQMNAKLNSGNPLLTSRYLILKVESLCDQIFLKFPDGTEFGLLNNHATEVLSNVIGQSLVDFEAVADLRTLGETIARATKASDATLRVDINVYGSKGVRKEVGRQLSAGKMYLQHPDQQRLGMVYDNPHVLELPGLQAQSMNVIPQANNGTTLQVDDAYHFQEAVSGLYASLKRSSHLKRQMKDSRVKTSLLRHQEEALDFMMQRETGPITAEFSLWQRNEEDGQIRFCHVITKDMSSLLPSETGGGILADEMGMGKTLSILSLITKTLDHALVWARASNEPMPNQHCATKRISRATLVVVSSSLIHIWQTEIKKHLDTTLRTTKYHGQRRDKNIAAIADSDIVLTTYHTLAADFAAQKSPLHEISWFRVVLDEAHTIRRQTSKLYKTVAELGAKSRWCLTGTPIQNRLEDIGALLAFVRASQFDNLATFRRFIAIPFEGGEDGRRVASERLRLLLDSLCLRRPKELLRLPEPQITDRPIKFSTAEREQYEQTKEIMIREIRQNQEGADKKFRMFQAQLQLRILCNHGTFQRPFPRTGRNLLEEREAALCSIEQNGEVNCSSCRQSTPILDTNRVYRTYVERCTHVLCLDCLDEKAQERSADENSVLRCPLCHPLGGLQNGREVDSYRARQVQQENDYFHDQGHSSKIAALVSDLQTNLQGTKSIIFSCWTRTLNLIARHLDRQSIAFGRIDGECPVTRRQKILDEFACSPRIRVLVMTTGTGAFGLNLTVANRIFIVEPQWNPSVENQAIARALRLGQRDSVLVTRYVVDRTVEKEMRSQQRRKREMAELAGKSQHQ